jgi:hypothetical protein
MLMIDRVVSILQDLSVNEEAIQAVSAALQDGAELIETSSFMTADPLPVTAFGASDKGGLLGFHHDKARVVIRETLDAFMGDLVSFAEGVSHAVDLVVDADETAQADLSLQRQAAEILTSRSDFFASDREEQRARDSYPDSPSGAGGTTTEGTGS